MKRQLIAIQSLLLTMGYIINAKADSQYPNPVPITLATAEDFAPYTFINKNKDWCGINHDIAEHVFHSLGYKIKIFRLPRERIKRLLEKKELDGIVSNAPFGETLPSTSLWYSDELYTSEISLFTLTDTPTNQLISPIKSGSSQFIVGYIAGMGTDALQKYATVKTYRDTQLVRLLLKGRIDGAISDELSFVYAARELKVFDKIVIREVIESREIKIGLTEAFISSSEDITKAKLNEAIAELKKSDIVSPTIISYLSTTESNLTEKNN